MFSEFIFLYFVNWRGFPMYRLNIKQNLFSTPLRLNLYVKGKLKYE